MAHLTQLKIDTVIVFGESTSGCVPGLFTGLGPRGINQRFDLTFGRLPLTTILYMGSARKPDLQ